MGKTTKSKSEYTVEEAVERFLKLKVVLEIIKDKQLSDHNISMLSEFFKIFPYANCYDQICKNLAYFVKYDLDNFYSRLEKLRTLKKNSREWHITQMGTVGNDIFIAKYIHNPNMHNKPPGYRTSKSAIEFFKQVDLILSDHNISAIPIYHNGADKNTEFRIRDVNENWFCYDYTVKELNLIIEYNGDHCHPNKNMTTEKWDKWWICKDNFDLLWVSIITKNFDDNKYMKELETRIFEIFYDESVKMTEEIKKEILKLIWKRLKQLL